MDFLFPVHQSNLDVFHRDQVDTTRSRQMGLGGTGNFVTRGRKGMDTRLALLQLGFQNSDPVISPRAPDDLRPILLRCRDKIA